ncbi:EAL domain-containing protein, partial [uncultured Ruminococcus sp.]|uniref:EAL domain-containing protein n=1 Tax=uncultured Ruminococcus sp. TaxID=165186 RepID=UPI0025EDB161
LYGAEALVRWNSSGRLIYPGEFVEIFEKEHLISDLDFYVLEQVCINMRDWLDKGLDPVKISVNFSNDHLGDEDLVSRINEIVDKYGIEHSLIEIEMTETVDVNEINQLLSYVDGLHNNGFTVAIDDFGIGYSSLLMLQTISVDVLKIDKAFIAEVTGATGKRENIILRHIINMAEDLGVEIVAEGVETTDQLDNLNNMNCHRIQGYYFDKPLSADDYGKRLVQRCYAAVH